MVSRFQRATEMVQNRGTADGLVPAVREGGLCDGMLYHFQPGRRHLTDVFDDCDKVLFRSVGDRDTAGLAGDPRAVVRENHPLLMG